MKRPYSFLHILMWTGMVLVAAAVITAGAITNTTLRSIEKSLPNVLLEQLNDLSYIVEELSEIRFLIQSAKSSPSEANVRRLKESIESVQQLIIELRESYVFDNLIQASAFHAVTAPAVTDAHVWINEGVSGYGPASEITLEIILARISEAYGKSRRLSNESRITAQRILNDQRSRLDRFLFSANILFILTFIVTVMMIALFLRQHVIQRREMKAREDRRQALKSLKESELRFRHLAELLPQVVFETEIGGGLTFINRSAYDVFGYSVDDFNAGLNAVDMIIPEERDDAQQRIKTMIRGEGKLAGRPYTAVRKNGSTFPVLIYASVIREDARAEGLRGIIVDITEQEKLREERDRLQDQYSQAQKMEAVGLLAGGVAHDLNNMLSPVIGYAELLIQDTPSGDSSRRPLDMIRQGGLRARDLIRQLLAFGRKQTLEVRLWDMNQIISNFQSFLRRTIRENIRIEIQTSPGLPLIKADKGQIEQVIVNLALNAQDAMPEGGVLIIETAAASAEEIRRSEFEAIEPGRYIVLIVSDTGYGMDMETQSRIFEPFFTTKRMGAGTGMGLSTVYGVVKQHGGVVRVYSELEKGTVFRCYFPSVEDAEPAAAAEAPEQEFEVRNRETILVVEDNPEVLELTVNILRLKGYAVYAAGGGKECLDLLETISEPVDLLVTDVIMPDMNGKALYERIAGRIPGIKVLFMSGYTEDIVIQDEALDGPVNFIQKPFSVNTFSLKVRETLDSGKHSAVEPA